MLSGVTPSLALPRFAGEGSWQPHQHSLSRGAGEGWGGGAACLLLDADDSLAPDALSRLLTALESSPDVVAAVGAYTFADTCRIRHPPSGDLLPRLLIRNLFANGGHVLIRGEVLQRAGGFLTDIAYGEDWEFWTRIALQGPVAAVDGPPGTVRAAACGQRLSPPGHQSGRVRPLHGGDLRQPGPARAVRIRAPHRNSTTHRGGKRLDHRSRADPPWPQVPRPHAAAPFVSCVSKCQASLTGCRGAFAAAAAGSVTWTLPSLPDLERMRLRPPG